ncbi:MAG: aspartate--tRNA ligase [Lentisphaerae bacterium]|nr:aspartate--tRNA ligase [Lentisphaerota bacterium]
MNWQNRTGCGQVGESDIGRTVELTGWVDAHRDHGDVCFIHLRDWTGIVQVVIQPDVEGADTLREEFCLHVAGDVTRRQEGTENPGLSTGTVEVVARRLRILNASKVLPFPISEKAMVAGAAAASPAGVSEDLRLQYRYLDLRRPSMQRNLIRRFEILKQARRALEESGFIEVETPDLTKSTPEGARDYLVPSRVHPGCFYALPQSPQLFKQLLMVSGLERYYQVARCFRDEDLRPNRQPEFTQLDIEAAFIDEEFLYALVEDVLVRMFRAGDIELPRPFPRMTYDEAMATTGSDRPDLRFGLRFVHVTEVFRRTSYSIFKQVLGRGGHILGINVKGQSEALSKNVLQNEYAKEIVPGFGGKGMTWMRVAGGRLESNIVQFFSEAEQAQVMERFGCEDGDVLMLVADSSYRVATSVLGQLRLHVARRLGLIPSGVYCPVWVTDFPLFDPAEEGGVTSTHHPFTAPDRTDFDPANTEELLRLKSRGYDIVLNGEELGGGSIRINDPTVQAKIFSALGLSDADVEQKFGFFIRALDYGAPPHGGIALGVDRVVSMILDTPSIRDVIAFPKNRSAFCPLTEAPSAVARKQQAELGLLNLGGEEALPGAGRESLLEEVSWVSRIGVLDGEHQSIQSALDEAQGLAAEVRAAAGEGEPLVAVTPPGPVARTGDTPRVHPLAQSGEWVRSAPARKGDYFKVASILE